MADSTNDRQTELKPRVIIGVDGSKLAEEAFLWYIRELHTDNTETLVVHVVDPTTAEDDAGIYHTSHAYITAMEQSRLRGEEIDAKFTKLLKDKKVSGSVLTKTSARPGQMLVKTAKHEDASMVVVATRGQGTVARTILGSVSDYLVHHAPCPILVWREQ